MLEFHMPLALKIITISECLCYLHDKVTIFLNLTRFCPKIARILRNNCPQKYFFTNFWGYVPPVSYTYADRQYITTLRCPKRITRQAKVKQTSGPQTVKINIKSFFAFYTCFCTSISQIQFRILYVVRFRTFAFSHFAFYTCPIL